MTQRVVLRHAGVGMKRILFQLGIVVPLLAWSIAPVARAENSKDNDRAPTEIAGTESSSPCNDGLKSALPLPAPRATDPRLVALRHEDLLSQNAAASYRSLRHHIRTRHHRSGEFDAEYLRSQVHLLGDEHIQELVRTYGWEQLHKFEQQEFVIRFSGARDSWLRFQRALDQMLLAGSFRSPQWNEEIQTAQAAIVSTISSHPQVWPTRLQDSLRQLRPLIVRLQDGSATTSEERKELVFDLERALRKLLLAVDPFRTS